jgi:crossover junction endodeoxyribonuclease RuvC
MRPDRPNPDAAIKLGHARGAIISAVGSRGIAMVEYSINIVRVVAFVRMNHRRQTSDNK